MIWLWGLSSFLFAHPFCHVCPEFACNGPVMLFTVWWIPRSLLISLYVITCCTGFVRCAALGTFSVWVRTVRARRTGTAERDDDHISYLNRLYHCCNCHCLWVNTTPALSLMDTTVTVDFPVVIICRTGLYSVLHWALTACGRVHAESAGRCWQSYFLSQYVGLLLYLSFFMSRYRPKPTRKSVYAQRWGA